MEEGEKMKGEGVEQNAPPPFFFFLLLLLLFSLSRLVSQVRTVRDLWTQSYSFVCPLGSRRRASSVSQTKHDSLVLKN